jgi:hypothetical protein
VPCAFLAINYATGIPALRILKLVEKTARYKINELHISLFFRGKAYTEWFFHQMVTLGTVAEARKIYLQNYSRAKTVGFWFEQRRFSLHFAPGSFHAQF